jgi:hypothetical protein
MTRGSIPVRLTLPFFTIRDTMSFRFTRQPNTNP